MKHQALYFAVAGVIGLGTVNAANLEDVVSCYHEASGGYDDIKAVDSARYTGTMTMGPMQAPFTIEFKRPQRMRMEFEVQGMTGIQAYDGEKGWAVMPFLGKTTPEEMADDQEKSVAEMAEFDGPLVDTEAKGHTVSLSGVEEIEGTEAYVVNVLRAGGDESTMYLDTEYCLPIIERGTRMAQGNEMNYETTIGDYKEVGDIVLPHSIIQSFGQGQTATEQVITITEVELNPDIDDERFVMPVVQVEAEDDQAEGGEADA